jgi:hypothetical protein
MLSYLFARNSLGGDIRFGDRNEVPEHKTDRRLWTIRGWVEPDRGKLVLGLHSTCKGGSQNLIVESGTCPPIFSFVCIRHLLL